MDRFTIFLIIATLILCAGLLRPMEERHDGALFSLRNIIYLVGYLAIVVFARQISGEISARIFDQSQVMHNADGNAEPSSAPLVSLANTMSIAIAVGFFCGFLNFFDTVTFVFDMLIPWKGAHDDPKAWSSRFTLLAVATWLWLRNAVERWREDDPVELGHSVQRDCLILMLLPLLAWSTATLHWFTGSKPALGFIMGFIQPSLAA
ncbi:hypothetical protein AURDEDRAFT_160677 [Auricularia subglabra TFB-10046 SS5]|nr:hypothetical protein AURDEDRAFT_160677 [Auricularia subglabra TFB-10046 SS5]